MSTTEVKVPILPESVADATIAAIHKKIGDKVKREENLIDLETDKVVLEVPSPIEGILKKLQVKLGDIVKPEQILAFVEPMPVIVSEHPTEKTTSVQHTLSTQDTMPSPTVRRLLAEHELTVRDLPETKKDHRLTKEDVETFLKTKTQKTAITSLQDVSTTTSSRASRRIPMSRLRATIAERLVVAQHQAAMLTTFNEVNLKGLLDIRAKYKEAFEKKHGIKLGLMSFFTKAVVEALKQFPAVNASIDGTDIVYHEFYDIGIAVSTDRGLVVPVIRDADLKSMAEIERCIDERAQLARHHQLSIESMQGGTFTITNGGVFGSLLATPIINPPQTAILGMHKIEDRPIAESGQVVIQPMMYLALSYDHRLIDGKESVQFLVSVKSFLEDPTRLLLEV